VSKIGQAVKYERQLNEAKVKAHVDLTNAQLAAAEALTLAKAELLKQSVEYERRYTDGQFGQLNLVAQEHRVFHEREHILYEQAIEKAASSLSSGLAIIQADVDRFRDEATKWMTIERFEREHSLLTEKLDIASSSLSEKVEAEARVTLRSQAQEDLLARIAQNNKWLIGILITVAIFGITTVLHVFGII
jgi:hypothetical protein